MSYTIIPLTQGQQTMVSLEDKDLANSKWCACFYKSINYYYAVNNHRLIHRVILERILGRPLEKNEVCDHINGDTLDNRRDNLRVATYSQSNCNRRIPINNKSGHKGVHFDKKSNKWRAEIRYNKRKIVIGYFNDLSQAVSARLTTANQLHSNFAKEE